MSSPTPLSKIPRPETPPEYSQRLIEDAFQSVERELGSKFDRRGDLALEPGKRVVVASKTNNIQYAIGISAADKLTLINYATGVETDFVLAIAGVEGLAQALVDIESAYVAGDTANAALITINASAIATNNGAIATLSTNLSAETASRISGDNARVLTSTYTAQITTLTNADIALAASITSLTSAYQAADTTLQANITSEASTRASADTAIAATVTSLTATVGTNTAAISTEATARASGDSANASSITTLRARSVDANQNILANPSGANGLAAFPLNNGFFAERNTTRGWWITQTFAALASGLSKFLGWQYTAVTTNQQYTVSANFYSTGFTAGTAIFYIQAYSDGVGGGSAFVDSVSVPLTGGDQGRLSVTFTVPTGKTHVRVTAAVQSATAGASGARFSVWAAKLEQGATYTAFRETENVARFVVEVDATGGDPVRFSLTSDNQGGSAAALEAPFIWFGDNTVFEDAYNSFYTTYASKRLRWAGPFGASTDLVQWWGPTSVALNSETKTNGYTAWATDGKTYNGSTPANPLASARASNDYPSYVGSANPQVSSSVTITPQGGDGTYTYSWAKFSGDTITIDSASSATTTFRRTFSGASPASAEGVYRCTVTETSTGRKVYVDVYVIISYLGTP